ncbi:asparagine synthase (glutamine-hydrolyzing) [Pandoraea terrae]|uniref:asparagine synthase (glutamine-hydrolyzing) n=1 Tax=Pandoraea terrae TaxID=1537710 RepID=A0A5E4Y8D7_9BURK|nr:asparagine synthase (glutamine-hydrolyzing) [Pandoraea terrae]VVE44682.1 asparagine synthase (glutamine-hydrolyzing) [Pandoraea terrae]
MCGIVGIVQSNPVDLRHVADMADLIRHRGPDDEGIVVFPAQGPVCLAGDDTPSFDQVGALPYRPVAHRREWFADRPATYLAMGHRRLSIVDLSPLGHQPMSYQDRYWIVYNGEVFNYVELREELTRYGYRFRSHSDTEVLLAGYDRWGAGLLDRCNGMWSMAIYDREKHTLFLARDRFGVKPLYYRVTNDGASLAFASEIKAFSALPDWRPTVAAQPAFDFLAWGIQDHGDETLFQGVYQLPPGHFAMLQLNGHGGLTRRLDPRLAVTRWYDLERKHCDVPMNFDEAAGEFRRLFLDAVRLRMRADVPLGSCLSGGLDSSSIVCAVRAELDSIGATMPQKTFSSCSEYRAVDEREFIEEVTRANNVESTLLFPSGSELFERLDDLVWTQDEPFGSSSVFAQWCVFRTVRENGVLVMLDGQGADEQLAGYHGFLGARLAGLARRGQVSEFSTEFGAMRRLHGYGGVKFAEYLVANLFPGSIRPLGALRGMTQMRRDWIDPAALGARDRDPFVPLGARALSVRQLSLAQMNGSNLQMLLHWEDRNSMAHSIEARVPFLDYRLVEYSLNLPEVFKVEHGMTKRVLRQGMRGMVPEKVLDRIDKKGFLTAEEFWMKGDHSAQFAARLDEAIERAGRFIDTGMRDVLSRVVAGKAPFSYHVWRVISFGAWLKRFDITV